MSSIGKDSGSRKTTPKRSSRGHRSRHSSTATKTFEPNSWKARVFKKDKRGRWYIDNTRLIFEAQRMACNPDATNEEIQEVLGELDNQITKGENFRKEAVSRTERMTDQRKVMREEVARLNKKKEAVRKEYLKIHNKNEAKSRVQKFESIGDELDYDFAYQCLKLEVDQITNDVDFLRAAFGEEEDEEYIIAEGNDDDSIENETNKKEGSDVGGNDNDGEEEKEEQENNIPQTEEPKKDLFITLGNNDDEYEIVFEEEEEEEEAFE